jgi:hypothetical protein
MDMREMVVVTWAIVLVRVEMGNSLVSLHKPFVDEPDETRPSFFRISKIPRFSGDIHVNCILQVARI